MNAGQQVLLESDLVTPNDLFSLCIVGISFVTAPTIKLSNNNQTILLSLSPYFWNRFGKYSRVHLEAALPPSEENSWVMLVLRLRSVRLLMNNESELENIC